MKGRRQDPNHWHEHAEKWRASGQEYSFCAMKLLTEYIEHALQFERLAAQEADPKLKAQFAEQAKAYRELAAERAARYGLPPPSPPPETKPV